MVSRHMTDTGSIPIENHEPIEAYKKITQILQRNTHTAPFIGPLSGTTQVSQYESGFY